MALPRNSRLSSNSEIKRVFKDGIGLNSELFQFKFIPADAGPAKFAIIVSSKVSKKASIRNRIRRKLSETVRLNISKVRPGYLVVIVAKPKLASKLIDKRSEDFSRELIANLNKISQLTPLEAVKVNAGL